VVIVTMIRAKQFQPRYRSTEQSVKDGIARHDCHQG